MQNGDREGGSTDHRRGRRRRGGRRKGEREDTAGLVDMCGCKTGSHFLVSENVLWASRHRGKLGSERFEQKYLYKPSE